MSCLACDAARRDAIDLLRAVVDERDHEAPRNEQRVTQLLSGMDLDRAWRVAFFLAGVAAGITHAYSDATGLAPAEVVQAFADELTGDHHEH